MFAWRGLMLDVARHFLDVPTVLAVLEVMADLKLNRLHLHLSDDQGWRVQLASRPRLTERSGGTAVDGDPGGFYTAADVRRIVDAAAHLGIVVVPEIDTPGHVNAATHAYGELAPGGVPTDAYTGIDVGFSRLHADLPGTAPFVADVLGEVAGLVDGPWVHVGGDEALDPRARGVRAAGAPGPGRGRRRRPHGGRLAGGRAGPTRRPAPCSSSGTSARAPRRWSPRPDAARGVLLSPASRTYLDLKYDADFPLGLEWAGHLPLRQAYEWDPLDALDLPDGSLLGVEACLWTETVRSRDDLAALLLPRLAAVAEVAWSPAVVARLGRVQHAPGGVRAALDRRRAGVDAHPRRGVVTARQPAGRRPAAAGVGGVQRPPDCPGSSRRRPPVPGRPLVRAPWTGRAPPSPRPAAARRPHPTARRRTAAPPRAAASRDAGSRPPPTPPGFRAAPAGRHPARRAAPPASAAGRARPAARRPRPPARRTRRTRPGPAVAARSAGARAGRSRPRPGAPRRAGAGRRPGTARRPAWCRWTRSCTARTTATACSAWSTGPNVVWARNVAVRCRRPHGSLRYPECAATAAMARGCNDWSSRARIPPTNIDASPCTRAIAVSGPNQRGPGAWCTAARAAVGSGPATLRSTASAAATRSSVRRLHVASSHAIRRDRPPGRRAARSPSTPAAACGRSGDGLSHPAAILQAGPLPLGHGWPTS